MTSPAFRGTTAALVSAVILAGCASSSDYHALQGQNQQLQAQNQQLQQQVSGLQSAIKYTAESDLVFAPGSWQMTPQGKKIIGGLASKLAPSQQNKLLVSGYTDNTPIGAGLSRQGISSNEMLSQRRADSVMQYLTSQGVKPDMVAAKGFGATNPVASNSTEKGRAENRRVELSLATQPS
jgi:chemotaxis protein MotB